MKLISTREQLLTAIKDNLDNASEPDLWRVFWTLHLKVEKDFSK